jgi:hypothetical protein
MISRCPLSADFISQKCTKIVVTTADPHNMSDDAAEQMAKIMNETIADAAEAEAECARLRREYKETAEDLFVARAERDYLLHKYSGPMGYAAFYSNRFLDFMIERHAPAQVLQRRKLAVTSMARYWRVRRRSKAK